MPCLYRLPCLYTMPCLYTATNLSIFKIQTRQCLVSTDSSSLRYLLYNRREVILKMQPHPWIVAALCDKLNRFHLSFTSTTSQPLFVWLSLHRDYPSNCRQPLPLHSPNKPLLSISFNNKTTLIHLLSYLLSHL